MANYKTSNLTISRLEREWPYFLTNNFPFTYEIADKFINRFLSKTKNRKIHKGFPWEDILLKFYLWIRKGKHHDLGLRAKTGTKPFNNTH